MNVTAAGIAMAAVCAAAAPAWARQDPPKPATTDRAGTTKLASTVEFSFVVPVFHNVLDPVGLARFQVSLSSLLHGTLDDAVKGKSPFVKGAFFAGVVLADRAIAKVGHEYGHIGVFNRAGYRDFLLSVGRQDPEPLSFHEIFINSLIPQRPMAIQLEEEEALDAMIRFQGRDFEEFTAITFAGGLNQEQVLLNLYRDRVLKHQFGFFDTAPYVLGCVTTFLYSRSEGGDLDGYVDSLERAGFTSSIATVKALSLVRLLSGTAVSAEIGFYRAMSEDAFDGFAPRVIARGKGWTLLWPEFESFLTRRGPSVRASLPIRALGMTIIPGLETAIANEGLEFEAGVEATRPATPWLDVRASLFAGTEGGSWAEVGVAVKPDPAFSILASWHIANGYTFRRDVYGETFDFDSHVERGLQLGLSAMFKF
ncbi:MAG TPA: hypothetical protein VFS19_06130 [Planctomycetota bacterium]|nr:hypothetical protein [Planctomycetota bacterium]